MNLQQYLKLTPEEHKKRNEFVILPKLLRKYIVYARKYCRPCLTKEAKRTLLDFYLKLRKDYQNQESTPITTRQLESLIRLAEARAKVELRRVVTRQDALEVIEIMQVSLVDALSDEKGCVDFRRTKGTAKPKLLHRIKKRLAQYCDQENEAEIPEPILHQIITKCGCTDAQQYIDRLQANSFILMRPNNKWKVNASESSQYHTQF